MGGRGPSGPDLQRGLQGAQPGDVLFACGVECVQTVEPLAVGGVGLDGGHDEVSQMVRLPDGADGVGVVGEQPCVSMCVLSRVHRSFLSSLPLSRVMPASVVARVKMAMQHTVTGHGVASVNPGMLSSAGRMRQPASCQSVAYRN